MIAIIDYGMGNIHSVRKALESLGASVRVTNKPGVIESCPKIVLPGVGAFDDAMQELKRRDLADSIKEQIAKKKIFLGICLGMQLLFKKSQEAKKFSGLGIIKGEVKKFKASPKLKVPHMGWNNLVIKNKKCPLLKGLTNNPYVYFCHSYYPVPFDKGVIAAAANYGIDFASVIWQENIYAVQFHPEKSQQVGMRMLKNFVDL